MYESILMSPLLYHPQRFGSLFTLVQSTRLFTPLSIRQSVRPSPHASAWPAVHPSTIHQSVQPSIYPLTIQPPVLLPILVSVHLLVFLLVHPSIHSSFLPFSPPETASILLLKCLYRANISPHYPSQLISTE